MKTLLSVILSIFLWLSSVSQILAPKGVIIDSTVNLGLGTGTPINVLSIKNRVGYDGVSVQGGNLGASVPSISYYDSSGIFVGSLGAANVSSGGIGTRGLTFRSPAITAGTDNWFTMRYNAAANKLMFGSTAWQQVLQTGGRFTIAPGRGTNVGTDTTVNAIAVFNSNGIGFNTSGSNQVASAAVEIAGTTKGLLIPRLTGAQMGAIGSPATGLLIYNTDSADFCYYNGTAWGNVRGAAASNNFSTMTPPDTASIIAPTSKIVSVSGSDVTTNIATASDVTGLTFWGRANKKYVLHGEFRASCTGSGGVKFAVTGPTGSSLLWGSWIGTATVAGTPQYIGVSAGTMGVLSGTAFLRAALNGQPVSFTQYITTSSTAGAITVQFASGTATQTSTVLIGSTFQIQEVN